MKLIASVCSMIGVVAAFSGAMTAPVQSLVEIAAGNPDFSTLVSVLSSPAQKPVLDALSGEGPFTIFAPTNAAFAKIADALPTLSNEDITNVLLLHAVAGTTLAGDIPAGTTPLTTAGGGIVDLVNDMDGITYGGAKVVAADIVGSNGVIHVIDSVVLSAAPVALPSVVEIAAGNPNFSTLVSILSSPAQKPVLDALSGEGPFTVFAPTNAAFAKIAAALPTLSNEAITSILLQHAVAGTTLAGDIPAGTTPVTTAGGGIVDLVNSVNGITFGGANVVAADLVGSNGVVHVIDSVVLTSK